MLAESGIYSVKRDMRLAVVHTLADGKRNDELLIESEANARLIAAAPELLHALETAQATIERLQHAPGSANRTLLDGTLYVIKAAISKATEI